MKQTMLKSENGEKMQVSCNVAKKTATITTYYKNGGICAKYRANLSDEEVEYYDTMPSWNDWVRLLRESMRVR